MSNVLSDPRRHVNPRPIPPPNPSLREITIRHPAKRHVIHKPEAEKLGQILRRPPRPRKTSITIFRKPSEALDVVDEHAYALVAACQAVPGKRDVSSVDERSEYGGYDAGCELCVASESGGGLEDGCETPACYAVYEEADEEALVEEAGASLQSGSWKEEEA